MRARARGRDRDRHTTHTHTLTHGRGTHPSESERQSWDGGKLRLYGAAHPPAHATHHGRHRAEENGTLD